MDIKKLSKQFLLSAAMAVFIMAGGAGINDAWAATSGTWGTCPYTIDDDGNMVITGNGTVTQRFYNVSGYLDVKTIRAADGVTVTLPESCENMFSGCNKLTSFNATGWDTSNVTKMNSMFSDCNKLISLGVAGWDTSNVTKMGSMFSGCKSLYCDCTGTPGLDFSSWDTSNVTDMYNMFGSCESLQKINASGWNTSNVTNMLNMFGGCKALSNLDISGWDTSNVINMSKMFQNCSNFTSLDVSGFDTSNVKDTSYMFSKCSKLTSLDVSGWDTSNVTTMREMFKDCSKLTSLDVSEWDTSNVTNMNSMFYGCSILASLDVSGWDTSNVTNMGSMFENDIALTSLNIDGWDTSNVTIMGSMFSGCSGLTSLDVSGWDTSKVTSMYSMFSQCRNLANLDVSNFDTSNVTTMQSMFQNCPKLTSIDVSGWDTSNVILMDFMFYNCSGLTTLDVSGFNTSKVRDMQTMFRNCSSLANLDVSGFDTSNVTNMMSMFQECSNLTSLDVSGFDTSKVTDMSYMFSKCSKLTSLDVSGWDTSNVTTMKEMFKGCSKLITLDLSSFDTSKVTTMSSMFSGCSGLGKIVFPETFFKGTAWTSPENNLTWFHKRDLTGAKLYDSTEYTGTQIMQLSSTTTPTLGGTWQRADYIPHIDLGEGDVEYVSEDDRSEWVREGDHWVYTFRVFDDTLQYYLYEENPEQRPSMEGYTSEEMYPRYTIVNGNGDTSKSGTVRNREIIDEGSLEIRKTVVGSDTTEKFNFDVVLAGTHITGLQIFSGVTFNNGTAVVSLGNGETKLIEHLPAGTTYTVTERPVRNFETTSAGTSGTIVKDETQTAAFTNTYTPPEEEEHPADLTLKKLLTGSFESSGSFEFHVMISGLKHDTTYTMSNGSTFTSDSDGNADIEVTLTADQEVTFQDVPDGSLFTITEQGGEDYTASYRVLRDGALAMNGEATAQNTSLSTSEIPASEGTAVNVTFTNSLDYKQNIVVSKRIVRNVSNEYVDDPQADQFEMTIEFEGLAPGSAYPSTVGRIIADEDGYALKSFLIGHAETVTFNDIPVGTKYRVTETASAGYRAMYQITGLVNYDSTNGTHSPAPDETGENTQQNMALATNLQTVNMGEEATVTFMNEKARTGSVRLKKTNTSGTILPGAVFQAFEQLGAAPDKTTDRFLGEKTVGADGYITLTERAAGTYYFIETIAPSGYILDSTIHTVTLTAEDITAQNNAPADESLIPTVTVQNQKKNSPLGALKITKAIDVRHEAFGDPSFIFEITGDPSDDNTKGLKFTRMITMDEAKLYGYAVINDLPLGKYKVREINVSRYHLIDENPISVTYGTAGAIVTADATAEVTLVETPNAENVNGIVNYSNTFEQYEKFSHTSAVTNHIGDEEPEEPEPQNEIVFENEVIREP